MVLVDSSVWIEAARRNGSMDVKCGLEGLLEEYQAALCGLVWLEVLGGAREQERPRMESYLRVLPRLLTGEPCWNRATGFAAVLRRAASPSRGAMCSWPRWGSCTAFASMRPTGTSR